MVFCSELTTGALSVVAVVFVVEFSSIQSTANLHSMVLPRVSLSLLLFEDWTCPFVWLPSARQAQHGTPFALSQKMLSAAFSTSYLCQHTASATSTAVHSTTR